MYLHIRSKDAEKRTLGKTLWAWSRKYKIQTDEGEQGHKGMTVLRLRGSDSYSYGWSKLVAKDFVVEFTPKDLERLFAAAAAKNLLSFSVSARKSPPK